MNKGIKKEKAISQKKLWLRLTRACNNNCVFCLDKNNKDGKIIPLSEIFASLEQAKKDRFARIILSGGEATIHPEIVKIVARAKKLGFKRVQVITNGRMLAYGSLAVDLKRAGLDEVTFSMHAHKKELFEKISRVKGSYAQALEGLNNAIKNRYIVNIDIVITKLNYKYLREIMDFYIRLGIREFDLLHVIPFGDAWDNWDKLNFSLEKSKKYLDKALELNKRKDIFIWTNRLPAQYLEGNEDLIQSPKKLEDEVFGMRGMFDDFVKNGIVMYCRGERCQFCVMQSFCDDLIHLKENKKIVSRENPRCLNQKKNVRREFLLKTDLDIFNFLDFFVKYRYYVKSLRCKNCKFDGQCGGAWIDDVRKSGFKILKQIQ